MVDKGDFIGDSCSSREVLEVGDILLESIICNTIGVSEEFLSKFGELKVGSGLGVEGKEGGIEVFNRLTKGFLS